MKKLIVSIAAMTMLFSAVGCSSGPLSRFRSKSNSCQAPPANPDFGFQSGSQIISSGDQTTTSYMNDSYSQGDPYINGSNNGSATINPPVFDRYSDPSYGSTIVPPDSSGTLPKPNRGN